MDLANGKVHKARSCWEDLSAAIKAAQKLVCILARNLCVNTHLIRTGNKAATEVTIGQLLKDKAEAGVVVLVLLADLSHEDEDFNEETVQFFRRSKVRGAALILRRSFPEEMALYVITFRRSSAFVGRGS